MINELYTIGYSGYSIEDFLTEIKKHTISAVIDIRSIPYSKYHLDYNKETLKAFLKANGILYRNYAKEFGAQQNNREFYSTHGYLDFDIFTKSDNFLSGVEKLCAGMSKGYSFVLMCSEKDPINCHRTIMVAREFNKNGYSIIHLLPNHDKQSQNDIEVRMLENYYPNRHQITLFESKILTNQDMIDLSYKRRNAEIAYSMEDEEDDTAYNRVYQKNSTAVL